MKTLSSLLLIAGLAFSSGAFAQNPQWSQPYEPFRIVGNVYYVGTYDLACYLIVTTKGSILINSGLASSAPMIKANIEKLGFNFADIKILLTTQAHYDHVAAMAEIKKQTGAEMWVDEKDAKVLADGGKSDYALMGLGGSSYKPVQADKLLKDQEIIQLGDTRLTMLHHPGHTKGSCSYLLDAKDEKKTYKVLISNMPTIVTDQKLTAIPSYPDAAKDFAYSLQALRKLSFDLWLASHASQFGMHSKHKPGDAYDPEVFNDRAGFDKSLDELAATYKKRLEEK